MFKRFHYLIWIALILALVLSYGVIGKSETTKPENVYRIVYEVDRTSGTLNKLSSGKKKLRRIHKIQKPGITITMPTGTPVIRKPSTLKRNKPG